MEEDGFDPCECIWNHQLAMRRLIALLRQSQSYCTDDLCFEELPGPSANSEQNLFFATFLAIAIAFFLIAFRPRSTQSLADDTKRPRDAEPDDSAPPPLI